MFGKNKSARGYHKISPDEAKRIMDENSNFTLLDVRSTGEFKTGHIRRAKCLPVEEIAYRAEKELPDKDALILTYCQSGMRSRSPAKTLEKMGYTNVNDFGGIMTWTYGTVRK